jgi:hypothetical protein
MKTIVKAMLLAVALLAVVIVKAQDKPIRFGIKAGVNLSNFSGDIDGNKAKFGYRAGVSLDYALNQTQDLYLLTGLNYSLQGAKIDTGNDVNAKINMSYLQLPIHIGYKLNIKEDIKIVFHAGSYLGYAADGKIKIGGLSLDIFGDEGLEELGSKMKRFDYGMGLGADVEYGRFGVDLGWDFGFQNLYDDDDASVRNMNAYLTVGYKF